MARLSVYVPDALWSRVPMNVNASRLVQAALSAFLNSPEFHQAHTIRSEGDVTFCFTCRVVIGAEGETGQDG